MRNKFFQMAGYSSLMLVALAFGSTSARADSFSGDWKVHVKINDADGTPETPDMIFHVTDKGTLKFIAPEPQAGLPNEFKLEDIGGGKKRLRQVDKDSDGKEEVTEMILSVNSSGVMTAIMSNNGKNIGGGSGSKASAEEIAKLTGPQKEALRQKLLGKWVLKNKTMKTTNPALAAKTDFTDDDIRAEDMPDFVPNHSDQAKKDYKYFNPKQIEFCQDGSAVLNNGQLKTVYQIDALNNTLSIGPDSNRSVEAGNDFFSVDFANITELTGEKLCIKRPYVSLNAKKDTDLVNGKVKTAEVPAVETYQFVRAAAAK